MKKSLSIKLALLGGASMALVACGDDDGSPPKDARFFSDATECSQVYGDAPCKDAAADAEQANVADAPKFTRQEQCEAEFGAGNCESRQSASGGGSFFMPMLMGYMMGNMMGGNRFSQPVYRGRDGSAVMNNGGRLFNVGAFGGSGVGRAASFRPATQIAQVSRGGFGGSSASFSSSAGS
jgi:uncharacterized protein YgiB involved in biofilm formation